MTRSSVLKSATAMFALAALTTLSASCASPTANNPTTPPATVEHAAEAPQTPKRVETMDGMFAYDVSNPQMVAFQADTVIVGTVTEKLVSTSRLGVIPETQFAVQVNAVLKGDVGEEVTVSQTGGLVEETDTVIAIDDVPFLTVGSAYVLSLVFDPAVNFYTVIAYAGQQEIPVEAAKSIEENPQQRGGASGEPEAVTVMRDAVANPVDPATVETESTPN